MRASCRKCGGRMDRIKVELLWYDPEADYNFLYAADEVIAPARIITKCRKCGHEVDIVRGG